jgi:CDP-paratose 2-epimerase
VLDYAKSYDLPTAVLRMSCIYGPRQFGTEDQGWVAHFLIRALAGEEISIYGDGKQVRDILHVNDAVAAYRTCFPVNRPGQGQGLQPRRRTPQLGEHPQRPARDRELTSRPLNTQFGDWRAGDQYFFVADTRTLESQLGWEAKVHWRNGLQHLAEWLADNRFGGRSVLRQEKRKVSA